MLPENITNPELHLLAYRSREALKARLKAVAREHSDRIKQLDHIMQQISEAPPPHSGASLDHIDHITLSPDLEKLLLNPTEGL